MAPPKGASDSQVNIPNRITSRNISPFDHVRLEIFLVFLLQDYVEQEKAESDLPSNPPTPYSFGARENTMLVCPKIRLSQSEIQDRESQFVW